MISNETGWRWAKRKCNRNWQRETIELANRAAQVVDCESAGVLVLNVAGRWMAARRQMFLEHRVGPKPQMTAGRARSIDEPR